MFQLIYISDKEARFENADTDKILQASRVNNDNNHITGFIIELEHSFAQVLEGDEADVRNTLERISGDPRHSNIRVVLTRNTRIREFGKWSMGFNTDLDPEQIKDASFLLTEICRTEDLTPQHGESVYLLMKGLVRE